MHTVNLPRQGAGRQLLPTGWIFPGEKTLLVTCGSTFLHPVQNILQTAGSCVKIIGDRGEEAFHVRPGASHAPLLARAGRPG